MNAAHLSVALFAAFFADRTRFTYYKQWMLQKLGDEATSQSAFLARYNFLHHCASLNKAQAKRRCRLTLAANFTPGLGACKGRVQPFKHLHHVTAHPQSLVLELWAPMGTCPGQYDNCTMVHRCIKEAIHGGAIIRVHKACRYIHVPWGTMRLLWQLWFYQNLSDTSPPS